MSKKKEQTRNLQKRLSAIVEIYIEQKGKERKQQMRKYIDVKMEEIILFQSAINKRKKKKDMEEATVDTTSSSTTGLHPSENLLSKLQTAAVNGQEISHADSSH